MNTVLQFACEFKFDKPSSHSGEWEFFDKIVLSNAYWLHDSDILDFHNDVFEYFCERDDVMQLEIGFSYHVFIVGTLTIETGRDYETGIEEVEGLYAELDDVYIKKMPERIL